MALLLDTVAAAEEASGHGSPRWCSGVLRGGAEIAKRRGGGGPGRGGRDAGPSRGRRGAQRRPGGGARWLGHVAGVGMQATELLAVAGVDDNGELAGWAVLDGLGGKSWAESHGVLLF